MISLNLYFAVMGLYGVGVKEIVLISGVIILLVGISEEVPWTTHFLIRAQAAAQRFRSQS